MKLRQLIIQYPKPTTEEIKAARERTGMGMQQCKKLLTKPDEVQLQFCEFDGAAWEDVPKVYEDSKLDSVDFTVCTEAFGSIGSVTMANKPKILYDEFVKFADLFNAYNAHEEAPTITVTLIKVN